jgi:hypothetical protein
MFIAKFIQNVVILRISTPILFIIGMTEKMPILQLSYVSCRTTFKIYCLVVLKMSRLSCLFLNESARVI